MAERLAFWEEPKRWLNQTRARDTFCLKFSNKIRMLDFKGEFVGGIENSILINKIVHYSANIRKALPESWHSHISCKNKNTYMFG